MAGIYIHIPFCKQRCIYCDFYSTTNEKVREQYVEALCMELELRKDTFKENISTIYIGGGTPSQLQTPDIKKIRNCIDSLYRLDEYPEFTIEANPDDINTDWLEGVVKAGVNRISMGIQSFQDKYLRLLNRRHDRNKAINAVELCCKHGIRNISIDLIYGIPGQTLEEWKKDVLQALALPITHLSAYALIYEKDTALWKMREKGLVRETDEELSLAMFEYLIDTLTANSFEHYEISNFSKPGFRSRHNSSYWQEIPYLGCGASAHSFLNGTRMYHPADIYLYMENIKQAFLRKRDLSNICICEKLSQYERYNDKIITALRTSEGLDLESLEKEYGNELKNHCMKMAAPYIKNNTLQLIVTGNQPQGVLKLTRQGIFISDGIMSDLLWVE